jgi:hypothetical protein
MTGTRTVTVSATVTSGGGTLDGDQAHVFQFSFKCGNWKTPLSDIIHEEARAQAAALYPGEDLIETNLVRVE